MRCPQNVNIGGIYIAESGRKMDVTSSATQVSVKVTAFGEDVLDMRGQPRTTEDGTVVEGQSHSVRFSIKRVKPSGTRETATFANEVYFKVPDDSGYRPDLTVPFHFVEGFKVQTSSEGSYKGTPRDWVSQKLKMDCSIFGGYNDCKTMHSISNIYHKPDLSDFFHEQNNKKTGDFYDHFPAIRDFTYAYKTLPGCPDTSKTPKCMRLDLQECEIGSSSKGLSAVTSIQWDNRAPAIRCKWRADRIDTEEQLLNLAKFTKPQEKWTDLPVPPELERNPYYDSNPIRISSAVDFAHRKLCSQKSAKCPNCLRINEDSPIGEMCRAWYPTKSQYDKCNPQRDFFNLIACSKGQFDECACMQRSLNPDYDAAVSAGIAVKLQNAVKTSAPFEYSDACWYTPCRSERSLRSQEMATHTCPDVCQLLVDQTGSNDVKVNGKSVINCFNERTGDQKEPEEPAGVECPEIPKSKSIKSVLTGFLAGIGLALVVLAYIVKNFFLAD